MVAVGVKLFAYNNVHILLHVSLSGNVLPAKVNNSMFSRNSTIPGSKNVSGDTVTFRAALKAVGKTSENMSSTEVQKYINQCKNCSLKDISTMQNIRMTYELYERLHRPGRTDAAELMSQLSQKDIKEGNMIWPIEKKILITKERGMVKSKAQRDGKIFFKISVKTINN